MKVSFSGTSLYLIYDNNMKYNLENSDAKTKTVTDLITIFQHTHVCHQWEKKGFLDFYRATCIKTSSIIWYYC